MFNRLKIVLRCPQYIRISLPGSSWASSEATAAAAVLAAALHASAAASVLVLDFRHCCTRLATPLGRR